APTLAHVPFLPRRSSDLTSLVRAVSHPSSAATRASDITPIMQPAVFSLISDSASWSAATENWGNSSARSEASGPWYPSVLTEERSEEHTPELQSRFELVC